MSTLRGALLGSATLVSEAVRRDGAYSAAGASLRVRDPPNQQLTLNRLPTELQCRNFVNKCQWSIKVGAKCAKTVCNG